MRYLSACCVLAVVAIAAPARASVVGASTGLYAGGAALPSVKADVHVEVRGAFADVVVTQTFRNDQKRGVEAIYVFPLPGDAAVRSMTIETGDRTISAQIARRDEARRAYEDAVSQGVVAALTEEERANVFTQQVTGIAPGDEVKVELRFDCGLSRWRDGWELALPLVVGPRHVPGVANGEPTHGTGTAPDTTEVDDASRITPPVRGDGGGNPITATIDVGDVEVEALEVPSHDASIRRSKGRTVAQIKDLRSDRDLVVRWASSDLGAARALTERTDDGGVISLVVEAPHPTADAEREARKWIFVLDVSGSMDGSALVLLRRAADALIDRVGDERFAILGPKGGSLKWRHGERGRALSHETVEDTDAAGGTALGDLLTAALADATEDVAVVVISDGLIADDVAVAARADGARGRVHTIGVGSAPNRWLLDELARRGHGVSAVLGAGDDVDAAVADLMAAAAAPLVTPTVDWGGLGVHDLVPATMPAIAAGRAVVISAKLDRVADARLTVYAGDRTLDVAVTEEGAGTDGLVARRWARARIDELVVAGASAETIAQLGLTHGLITPYTAFLARGTETTVDGGVKTTIAIPVSMPAGMRWQSVFGPGGDIGETTVPTDAETRDGVAKKDKQPQRIEDDYDRGGAGGGDATTTDSDDEAGPQPMPAAPTWNDAGSNGGFYEAEEILLHGESVFGRTWSGAISLSTGLHTTEDDRGATFGVSVGVARMVTPGIAVGVQARVQDAPSIDGGVDVDAYVGVRKFFVLGGLPIVAVDLGVGTGLDDPGLAWRLGLRFGWWRLAPFFGVDQTYVRAADDASLAPRTTVGGGLEWRF